MRVARWLLPSLALLAAGCDDPAPARCVLPPVPADWHRATLSIADARLSLPPVALQRIGPVPGRMEGWYGRGFQVLASVALDGAAPPSDTACIVRVGDRPASLRRLVRRPRPPSRDSVYGGQLHLQLGDGRALAVELGAEGRARFDSLMAVFTSLELQSPR
ncbi:MAG TPA: hypothetical protein VEA99_00330 [Gemmatimonadaceae bacterium]|nr:hypothetical protein [Gemmatimonadaceae bacterium]